MTTIAHGAYPPPFDKTPAPADAWPPMTDKPSFAVETPQELIGDLLEELQDAMSQLLPDDITALVPLWVLVGRGRTLVTANAGVTDEVVAAFADECRVAIVQVGVSLGRGKA